MAKNRTTEVHDPGAGEAPRLQLTAVGQDAFFSFRLPEHGVVVVGRGDEVDVRVEDSKVSRRHVAIHVGPRLEVEDLGSANGTLLGDRRLDPHVRVPIAPGAAIHIGSTTLTVQEVLSARPRRKIWTHAYFEARLDEECTRTEQGVPSFVVGRLRAHDGAALLETLEAHLQPGDVVASFAPNEYEVLVRGCGPDAGARLLAAAGDRARAAVASCPADGRTPDELLATLSRRLRLLDGAADVEELVVQDPRMRALHELVGRIASGSINVLVLGETGVGKEIVAEAIHRQSARAAAPLLRLNCAALSEGLLETELFGHERGSFTGAVQAKAGLLETADGGTVFLDEVGELPPGLQAKLLRVIERKEVMRVGGLKARALDVRFVSATNRDLEGEVARGGFRADLFYRLNGFAVSIPPLRERRAEIAGLARSFVQRCAGEAGRIRAPELSAEALEALEGYAWPGNVRELRNVVERAVLLCLGPTITLEHLPAEKMRARAGRPLPPPAETRAPPGVPSGGNEAAERDRIVAALAECGGNQTHAARRLGIARRTLINRIVAYGLPRPRMDRKRPGDGGDEE